MEYPSVIHINFFPTVNCITLICTICSLAETMETEREIHLTSLHFLKTTIFAFILSSCKKSVYQMNNIAFCPAFVLNVNLEFSSTVMKLEDKH